MIHSTGDTLLLDDGPGLQVRSLVRATAARSRKSSGATSKTRCAAADWRINGAGNAAEALGLHPNTLRFRMKKLGIQTAGSCGAGQCLKRLLA